jgi:tetratricopeptide (TPR) repeat protein
MVMQSAISQDEGLVADKKPTPIIRDADQLFRRGIDALEHDRFEEAAGLLQQAVGQESQLPMAWLGLGIALGRLLRIPEATAALENAIALDPEAFYPHFRMAELHLRVGLIAQAEEELTRAMDLSTNDYERRLVRELRAVDRKRGRPGGSGALTSAASSVESRSHDYDQRAAYRVDPRHRSACGRSRDRGVRRAADTRGRGSPDNGSMVD